MTQVRLEPAAPQSQVKHSIIEPLCSLKNCLKILILKKKNQQTIKHFDQSIKLKNENCDPSKYLIDHPHSNVSKRMVESIRQELFACWEIFHDFMLSAVFFFFSNLNFLKNSFRNTTSVPIRPNILGTNCLQRLSANDKRCHLQVNS